MKNSVDRSRSSVRNRHWPFFAVAFLLVATTEVKADLITNGSFEIVTPSLSNNEICASPGSSYPYSTCTATGWTGIYQIGRGTTTGIGGSSFNIPQPDPNGSQALILQGSSNATQSISVPTTGAYTLTFYAANRDTSGLNGAQTLTVLLDNVAVAGGTYASLPFSWTEETLHLSLSSGSYSLDFEGLGVKGKDVSAFVDDISLVPQNAPEPASYLLFGIGFMISAGILKRYRRWVN